MCAAIAGYPDVVFIPHGHSIVPVDLISSSNPHTQLNSTVYHTWIHILKNHIYGKIGKLYKIVCILMPKCFFRMIEEVFFLSQCLIIYSNTMRYGFLFSFDLVDYLLSCSVFLFLKCKYWVRSFSTSFYFLNSCSMARTFWRFLEMFQCNMFQGTVSYFWLVNS